MYGVRGRYGELLGEDLVGVEWEIAVHLAGRDVVEPLHLDRARRLEQRLRTERVRAEEAARVDDGEAVVRLGREVHDHLDALVLAECSRRARVADVTLDEHDSVLDRGQVRPVAGVRQQVVDDDMVVRVALEPVVDEVGADKAGPARDEETHRAKG